MLLFVSGKMQLFYFLKKKEVKRWKWGEYVLGVAVDHLMKKYLLYYSTKAYVDGAQVGLTKYVSLSPKFFC